jgi:hypothetical protein
MALAMLAAMFANGAHHHAGNEHEAFADPARQALHEAGDGLPLHVGKGADRRRQAGDAGNCECGGSDRHSHQGPERGDQRHAQEGRHAHGEGGRMLGIDQAPTFRGSRCW